MNMKKQKGITLIALIITIIILLILAGVVLNLALGKNGIVNNAEIAREKTNKEEATEKINLKITNNQINKYAQEQRMPTLQELADSFCEDKEIEYVELTSKKTASLKKIQLNEKESFFTKLKKYSYEFEINSSLQLASVDGIKTSTINNHNVNDYSLEEVKTNETWMGKTIYRKTIYIESLPNATTKVYEHGIENIEIIWTNPSKSFIIINIDAGRTGTFPYVHAGGANKQLEVEVDNKGLMVSTYVDRSNFSAYVTVEYTKTTDI